MRDATQQPAAAIDPDRARRFLDEAGAMLFSSLDYEVTLRRVAALAVPELADWCAVDVLERDGSLRTISSERASPEEEALLAELSARFRRQKGATEGALRVIATGEAELRTDVTGVPAIELAAEEREIYQRLHPTSYMIVPLITRGRTLGTLRLISTRDDRHYVQPDLDFALELAARCALAVDNARRFQEAEQTLAVLDAVFEAAPVGLGLLDTDLRFVRVNERLARLNRRPVAEHIGNTPAFIGAPGAERLRLYREVLRTGEPLIEHEMANLPSDGKGESVWLVSCTAVPGPDGKPAGVLETVIDITERRRLLDRERGERERATLLARAGETFESTLDFQTTLRNVARFAVPTFCDWCSVHLLDDSGRLGLVAVAHEDPDRERWAWEMQERYPIDPDDPRGAAAVVRTGRAEVVNDVDDALLRAAARDPEHLEILRGLGLTAGVTVPLRARGRTLGAMSFVLARPGGRFTADDVTFAIELGRRAAVAVDNARLATARARIAHTLQAKLLPPRLPTIPGVELAARYRAAGEFVEVGGDFYDVMPAPDGEWLVVVGDVTGKGAEAAAVTALARYTLRAAVLHVDSPAEMLRVLNEAMLVQNDTGEFCTVCLARMRVESDLGRPRVAMRLALGGHEPAIVLRADGTVEECGRYGSLIGLLPEPDVADVDVELSPGDMLLLHTDGVTDAGMPDRPLGQDGLMDVVAGLRGESADRILDAVEQAAVHVQEGEPRDDIALVGVRLVAGMVRDQPGRPDEMSYAELQVPGGPEGPFRARRALQDRLRGRVPERLLEDAGLLLSELVTNSVVHGQVGPHGRVGVRLGVSDSALRVEVSDPGPGFDPDRPAEDQPDDPGGYGLFLVTQLADAWGVAPADRPTKVWFELRYAGDDEG